MPYACCLRQYVYYSRAGYNYVGVRVEPSADHGVRRALKHLSCRTYNSVYKCHLCLSVLPWSLLGRLSAQVLVGSFLAVDSFFLLSGFLLSATLLPKLECPERPLTPRAWRTKVYLHRYVRLTPTLAFVTVMSWKVLPLIGQGQGPLWWDFARNVKEGCQE